MSLSDLIYYVAFLPAGFAGYTFASERYAQAAFSFSLCALLMTLSHAIR